MNEHIRYLYFVRNDPIDKNDSVVNVQSACSWKCMLWILIFVTILHFAAANSENDVDDATAIIDASHFRLSSSTQYSERNGAKQSNQV